MDFEESDQDLEFRKLVRSFMLEEFPAKIRRKVANYLPLTKEEIITAHKALHKKGWAGINWPREYGGTGWSARQKIIFLEEFSKHDGFGPIAFGVNMLAPILYTFGNEDQKKRFLNDILECKTMWCQGYSEPGAGSDLASLKTRAVISGDDYIVNGQKTWTSLAHLADWMFCLVRTDPKPKRKQQGISFLLIDMKSPGLTVKPIRMLDGGHEVNEVFFEDVKVPVENLIGTEGEGWAYGKALLQHERTSAARIPEIKATIRRLKRAASTSGRNGRTVLEDPTFSKKLALIEIRVKAQEITWKRLMLETETGKAPGFESSILKLRSTEIIQSIDKLIVEAAGYRSTRYRPEIPEHEEASQMLNRAAHLYFNHRKDTIYGGTSEIQRLIIAKQVLKL
jgi:alkylation response protein AidB-like acyl-CoA dehydrogenase